MRRKNSKRTKLVAILLALAVLLSVGYAALSTNLAVNGTATLKVTTGSGGTTTPTVEIGNNVNFTTSINGVELDSWKVLDIEEVGGVSYTYLILDGKLHSNAVTKTTDIEIPTLAESIDSYSIGTAIGDLGEAKDTFVSSMNNTTYWQPLVTHGVLNGNSIASSSAYAIGSPTLQMFANSWNKSYPSNTIDVSVGSSHTEYTTWTGYKMKYTSSSTWDSCLYLSTPGSASSNTLYFPKDSDEEAINYWLATEYDEDGTEYGMFVDSDTGYERPGISYEYITESGVPVTLRPVVCIPTSLFN